MPQEIPAGNKILDAVIGVPDCRMEQLASLIPELTSAQLFGEVKRLSEAGHVRVVLDGRGMVTVRRANQRGRHWEVKKEEHPSNDTGATRLSAADAHRAR